MKPVGIRVTLYGHFSGIRAIMNALEEEERAAIRNSSIGKFVHALQLVLVEAALLDVVQVNSTSSFESQREGEKDESPEKKIRLNPAHARELHEEEKTVVDYIITDDGESKFDKKELVWSNKEEDVKLCNFNAFERSYDH
ncbi:unnamed protein product [Arabis nemorensis]|uniref:Uncharacterized protein n=1 Tax=Arabis nemorensis TaxID=586526 RepID=A0A565C6S9_9BRAS|nr:unnamed protein product [Arabis nemorensis]